TEAHLVVIAVPELQANAVANACFRQPWTVFMEKPAGLNLCDAEEIHSAAQEAGRRVLVGVNRRLLSSTRTAAVDLAGQEGPRFIHAQDQQDLALARSLGHP